MKKLALALALILTLTACGTAVPPETGDLMEGVRQNQITPIALESQPDNVGDKTEVLTDFSLHLLTRLNLEENTLISPLSIASALAMVANGGDGETLEQMEGVLGTDVAELNEFLYAYRTLLPSDEKYRVNLANSIWFRDDPALEVHPDFLQKNKDYYDAAIYRVPFDDSTKKAINDWVKEKTDGQIEKLMEQAPPRDGVMYLINALSFDAEWEHIYEDTDIRPGKFTAQSGEKQASEMMNSQEFCYLKLPNGTGFTKPYADGKYSFVALLPDEGVSMSDFTASLSGEAVLYTIKNASQEMVSAAIPKFSFAYSRQLNDVLGQMGMTDAFDANRADFSGLGTCREGNLFISQVLHKTKITLDEKGTKAGAVTAVEMRCGAAAVEPKQVILDRPFYFMIVDSALSLPLFMGTVNSLAA
ncbi:MAG: serpin family protein [Oscillospiraceae bacterium]